jgi:hypothetical protein
MFTMLGQLFTEAYQYATLDAQHSAAFQLAIWEIVYDPISNLGLGSFQGVEAAIPTPSSSRSRGSTASVTTPTTIISSCCTARRTRTS